MRIWYSNQIEALVDALIDNIEGLRNAGEIDPFDTVNIVVPNRNISTYLKFEVAKRTGIVANWRFHFLGQFFRNLINPAREQILGRIELHTLLLDLFADESALADDELASVRSYIGPHDASHDARARRAWQLAAELSRVFDEYVLWRPAMLADWKTGTVLANEPFASTEKWQRHLWNTLFKPGGRVEQAAARTGRRLMLLPDVIDAARPSVPAHLHVFGLSYVATSFYRLFNQLSAACDLRFYTLNPCMEYWEDVPAGWTIPHRAQWIQRQEERTAALTDVVEDDSPGPLRAWGRPGRDNIWALNTLTQCDFEGVFVDPLDAGDTLLHRLQHDILVRQPIGENPARDCDDDSITVLACPTVQREVEVIASEILDLQRRYAEAGNTLHFHEIAVIVSNAQREAYQAHIASIFPSAYDIPHNIIDIKAAAHRRYLEAVELLIALPFGRFTRRELLRLLTHENVVAGCEDVDPDQWVRWCAELNIFHGADHHDHDGTYIADNLYHWDQGLKRLVLGSFMTGAVTGEEQIADIAGERLVPFEVPPGDVASAAQFVRVARDLIADSRALGTTVRPLSDWMREVDRLISKYLVPIDDDDEFDRSRVSAFLTELADDDLSCGPVPFRVACQFVQSRLNGLEITRGQYLAEGVVVSSFLPMRPVPFKAIFVTGLSERGFPRAEVRSLLDLRWSHERTARGQFVSARAQDEYMFLETLICARDRFYMSYVARDSFTGESLEPSAVVRLLWFMLEESYSTAENLAKRWVQHPLRRFDDAYFGPDANLSNLLPEARREATTLQARRNLEDFAESVRQPVPDRATLLAHIDDVAAATLRDRLGLIESPHDQATAKPRTEITLYQLQKFLESPTQGTAKFHLGMREDDDDPFSVEDELFESPILARTALLKRVFMGALLEHGLPPRNSIANLVDRLNDRFDLSCLRGEAPSGPFGAAELKRSAAILRHWLENCHELELSGTPRVIAFGRQSSARLAAERRDAIRIETSNGPVLLTGQTEMWWPTRGTMLLSVGSSGGKTGIAERPFLRGFLDQAFLAAAGEAQHEWTVTRNPGRPCNPADSRVFSPFDQPTAITWLTTVIESMSSPGPTWFLPIEAIFSFKYGAHKSPKTLERIIDEVRDDTSAWYSFHSGPLHNPQDHFDAPPDPWAVAQHRLGAYIERRQV